MTNFIEEEIDEAANLIGEFGGLLFHTIAQASNKDSDYTDRKKIESEWRMFGAKLARFAS